MKKALILLLLVFSPLFMMAQNENYYLYKIVTFYGSLNKEGLKVNVDDGKSVERLKDANGNQIKFNTPADLCIFFLKVGICTLMDLQQKDTAFKELEDLYLLHTGFLENLVQKKNLRKL